MSDGRGDVRYTLAMKNDATMTRGNSADAKKQYGQILARILLGLVGVLSLTVVVVPEQQWIVIGTLIASVTTLLLGTEVTPRLVNMPSEPVKPAFIEQKIWSRIADRGAINREGGKWIGRLEGQLFLAAFWSGTVEIVAGWLAFKLASKWESWKNIVQVPVTLPGTDAKQEVEWFAARAQLGSWLLARFWIGTLANMLAALLSSLLGQELVRSLPDALARVQRLLH